MWLLPALPAYCLLASLFVVTSANADKRYYPVPSNEPLEIGAEKFRDRHLTLRELEGVYFNFNTIRSAGKSLGINVPATLQEQVQQKIEAAGLRYLSEEEMLMTPGQPVMNLWPTYEGGLKNKQDNATTESGEIPVPCSASLWVELAQSAMLLRQPENQFKLTTWGNGDKTRQCEGRAQWMADAVLKQVDNFIADFHKAQRKTARVIVANTADVPQQCSKSWVTHLNVFTSNKTNINENIKPILDKLKDVAARCKAFSYIIETHADQRGDAEHNRLLTEGRARSIKDYLISKDMAYHRIHMRPMGESAPITTGTTQDDHAKNRRVVIIPIKQEDIANAQSDEF